MNTITKWDQINYKDFMTELYQLQDIEYQKFHGKLVKEEINIIGIRVPILKTMAKEISKFDPNGFIQYNTHQTYEECMLHGLLLGYQKLEFRDLVAQLEKWFPYNTNWALNDVVAANLKIWKKHKEEGFPYILQYLKDKNSWVIRFGLVLLLDYYVDAEYIGQVLELVDQVTSSEYYVQMANAWLISLCYIKELDKTKAYLKHHHLDQFTYKKAIQKTLESYRISEKEKEYLRTIRNQ